MNVLKKAQQMNRMNLMFLPRLGSNPRPLWKLWYCNDHYTISARFALCPILGLLFKHTCASKHKEPAECESKIAVLVVVLLFLSRELVPSSEHGNVE